MFSPWKRATAKRIHFVAVNVVLRGLSSSSTPPPPGVYPPPALTTTSSSSGGSGSSSSSAPTASSQHIISHSATAKSLDNSKDRDEGGSSTSISSSNTKTTPTRTAPVVERIQQKQQQQQLLQQRPLPRRLVVKRRNQDSDEKTSPPSWGILKKMNRIPSNATTKTRPTEIGVPSNHNASVPILTTPKLTSRDAFPTQKNNASATTTTTSNTSTNSNSSSPGGSIVVPAANVPISSSSSYSITTNHNFHHRPLLLPILNASALLDAKDYCIKSADASTNKSGTAAAQRLLRGKQEFLNIVRGQINQRIVDRNTTTTSTTTAATGISSSTSSTRNYDGHSSSNHHQLHKGNLAYVIQGHGIPIQLIQDHINLADALLTYHHDAAECSFHNYRGSLELEWMRIRAKDGTNRASAWPIVQHPYSMEWDHSMQLYLHVMNRMATQLGIVLVKKEQYDPTILLTHEETRSQWQQDDEYNNSQDFAAVSSLDSSTLLQPRHWNVEFLRGLSFPPERLPIGTTGTNYSISGNTNRIPNNNNSNSNHNNSNSWCPIVEWTPMKGIAAPGHVCIRLQGFPSLAVKNNQNSFVPLRRRKPQAVTLCFDACFRY